MAIIKRDTDYALRALLRLHAARRITSVPELVEAASIPIIFLRKIMQKLHAAGLVESEHGPAGGYRLRRKLSEITVLDVIEAVQGPVVVNQCFIDPAICENVSTCPLRLRLAKLDKRLKEWLAEMNLAAVARRARRTKGGRG